MTILNKIGYSTCGLSWKHTHNQHAPNKLISKNHVNIPGCDYCSHSQAQLLDPWWMNIMVHLITQGKVYPYAFTRFYLIVFISEGRLFVCLSLVFMSPKPWHLLLCSWYCWKSMNRGASSWFHKCFHLWCINYWI